MRAATPKVGRGPFMARTEAPSTPSRWSRWSIELSEASEGRPLCLSIANTRHFRNSGAPRETLVAYDSIVDWAVLRKIWTAAEGESCKRESAAHVRDAAAELARVIALREAVARIFAAAIHSRTRADSDMAIVLASFNEAAARLHLAIDAGRLVPTMDAADETLAVPRWHVALSAIGLLGSDKLGRVKECADDRGCGWLFLDTTRNASRRFCFSSECGNRARQIAYRARHRDGGDPPHGGA